MRLNSEEFQEVVRASEYKTYINKEESQKNRHPIMFFSFLSIIDSASDNNDFCKTKEA